jgi:hypothetical protein
MKRVFDLLMFGVLLTGCTLPLDRPYLRYYAEVPRPVKSINISSLEVYDDWRKGEGETQTFLTLTFKMEGNLKTDERAKEMADIFKKSFVARLERSGLTVHESSSSHEELSIKVKMAYSSALYLVYYSEPRRFVSVSEGYYKGTLVFALHYGKVQSILYSPDTLVKEVAEGAAEELLRQLNMAVSKKMGSDPVVLQEDSAVVAKQMKPSDAAQFTTKEEVVDHLVAHSPYRGEWVFSGPRGGSRGGMTAGFTKDGGRLDISGTQRYIDGDIKDLAITIEGDKVTVSFKNSTTGALYVLEVKEKGNLVGTASRADGTSDIDLSPTK